jgi:hypothetical protein
MKSKCYFCDDELQSTPRSFSIGSKEEFICEECYIKTVNRKKALEGERSST